MAGLTANLWSSAATFRRGTAEKAAFVLLNLFDLVLTVMAVSLGFEEMNPVMRYLVAAPALLLAVKVVLPPLLAWLVPAKLLWPSIAFLGLVVIWDIKEFCLFMF